MNPFRVFLTACCMVIAVTSCAGPKKGETLKPAAVELDIIPKPVSETVYEKKLILPSEVRIVAVTVEEKEQVALVRGLLDGLGIRTRDGDAEEDGSIQIALQSNRAGNRLGREGYILEIDESGVRILADGGAGLFYGVQSFAQLLPVTAGAPIVLPYLRIIDHPDFAWRGLHLDVVRHFFPVRFVKKYIDQMAKYKLNVLHLHLTDDQGWRIEIEKYPKLTEVGSIRRETMVEKNFKPYIGDGREHGGYYTQREIRDLVHYAKQRHVTLVPEIEMPGHAMAALAAYPEYSCTGGPFAVKTKWGISKEVFCPTEETFQFLTDILDEIVALFPSQYIHVGGDEVPKERWIESAFCQELMRKEGIENEAQLQNYFMARIEQHLLSKNRKLIGWDEIVEGGGLTKTATVMSWRGEATGIHAANEGYDVVMTPNEFLYFDYYQGDKEQEPLAIGGFVPLKTVYDFVPVSAKIQPENRHHIIGVQANVWTEYMSTADHVEYMVYPRALALAEVAWTPRNRKSWESFQSRLGKHFARFERDGVNYRLPEPEGYLSDRMVGENSIQVDLVSYVENGEIRYTLDGSAPSKSSPMYREPIVLDFSQTSEYQVRSIAVGPGGKASIGASSVFRKPGEQDTKKGIPLPVVQTKQE